MMTITTTSPLIMLAAKMRKIKKMSTITSATPALTMKEMLAIMSTTTMKKISAKNDNIHTTIFTAAVTKVWYIYK